jgi:hypothetical protein
MSWFDARWATWQIGIQQVEIQVPYLSDDCAEEILKPHRLTPEIGEARNSDTREDL